MVAVTWPTSIDVSQGPPDTVTVPETPVAVAGTAESCQVAMASKDKVRRIMPHCGTVGIGMIA